MVIMSMGIYCPFPITEVALVASVTRGAALLNCSGGVNTCVLEQKVMNRSPTFYTDSIDNNEKHKTETGFR